jgi:cytochrome c
MKFWISGLLILACAQAACSSAPSAAGNPRDGEQVYARCAACHSPAYNRTGPKHCGLLGRPAGSVKGFDYSPAMRQSKLVWSEKTLDAFLTDPTRAVPGTTMGYAGIPDTADRANLIAYLKQLNTGNVECRE